MYLFDTSFIIDFLKKDKRCIHLLDKLKPAELYLSVISLAELELGFRLYSSKLHNVYKNTFRKLVQVNFLKLIPVDSKIAIKYGEIQSDLSKKGEVLSQFDGIIASTAKAYGFTLITTDKDFKRIKGLKLLYPKD